MLLPIQAQSVTRHVSTARFLTGQYQSIVASDCDWECGTGTAAALAACAASEVFPPAMIACLAGLLAVATTGSCRDCISAYIDAANDHFPKHPL